MNRTADGSARDSEAATADGEGFRGSNGRRRGLRDAATTADGEGFERQRRQTVRPPADTTKTQPPATKAVKTVKRRGDDGAEISGFGKERTGSRETYSGAHLIVQFTRVTHDSASIPIHPESPLRSVEIETTILRILLAIPLKSRIIEKLMEHISRILDNYETFELVWDVYYIEYYKYNSMDMKSVALNGDSKGMQIFSSNNSRSKIWPLSSREVECDREREVEFGRGKGESSFKERDSWEREFEERESGVPTGYSVDSTSRWVDT
ncbi:hypothetical protein Scep_028142 [Stephania cephalantha]|uniref:Uncharacterized protein n=1 Tax=Stephania cephalantha TaxID=152367 RepID=A0AAP0EBJ7_9MAGN